MGFGRDFKQNGRGEVLTSLQLNVQPVGACTKQYNKILEDPTDDLYELVINTLPDGFEEDSLICAQIPGNEFNMVTRSQCARTDLNKRFLPRATTTTG